MTADERAIRELVATWMAATKAGDTRTILSLMTDDVVFMTTHRPPFGKEAFATTATGQGNAAIDAASDIRDLKVDGDLGRAYLTVSMTPIGGTAKRREGWTLSIFAKGADGKWRLARDANLLSPPGAA
jgi:uncharacterized protein (TIGR02246 family)